jgi:hypothetical protein
VFEAIIWQIEYIALNDFVHIACAHYVAGKIAFVRRQLRRIHDFGGTARKWPVHAPISIILREHFVNALRSKWLKLCGVRKKNFLSISNSACVSVSIDISGESSAPLKNRQSA